MKIKIAEQTFLLDGRRALFDVAKKRLVLADLHIGKSAHFRKSGLSMPAYGFQSDIDRLTRLLEDYQPKEVLILGDLFHSDHNEECEMWNELVQAYSFVSFKLVVGNHDRWSLNDCHKGELSTFNKLEEDGVLYTHEPAEQEGFINFCGHIHPGVRMVGTGKQVMKLSCFWLSTNQFVFPAFSELTGLYIVKPQKEDCLFIPLGDSVIEASTN